MGQARGQAGRQASVRAACAKAAGALANNRGIVGIILAAAAAEAAILAAWDIVLATTIATFFSVVVAPSWYFLKTKIREKSDNRMASANVRRELEDDLRSLDRSVFRDNAMSFSEGGITVYFMNRELNHDFYDSLKSSGLLNFLGRDAQQPIQSTYRKIKAHNAYLAEALSIARKKNNPYPKEAFHLFVWLDTIERDLKRDIPKIVEDLRERFGP